jgi:hypothetical protein
MRGMQMATSKVENSAQALVILFAEVWPCYWLLFGC